MNFMTVLMIALISPIISFAFQNQGLIGKYVNQSYNFGVEASVEVIKGNKDTLEFRFMIPCGTKLIPAEFRYIQSTATSSLQQFDESNFFSGQLEQMDPGASQCYTGLSPRILVSGNQMTIRTDLKIRVPGFFGSYDFILQSNKKE